MEQHGGSILPVIASVLFGVLAGQISWGTSGVQAGGSWSFWAGPRLDRSRRIALDLGANQ
jgi:hypothetical protein